MLDNAHAAKAIALAKPLVDGLTDQLAVVLAVATTNTQLWQNGYITVATESFGNPNEWEDTYMEIAHGKTAISARTGLTTREVQTMRPDLLEDSDVIYWGNAACGDLIVSCSGTDEWFDEAISKTVLSLWQAFIQDEFESKKTHTRGFRYNS